MAWISMIVHFKQNVEWQRVTGFDFWILYAVCIKGKVGLGFCVITIFWQWIMTFTVFTKYGF
jgi:hypothetical protein